MVLQGGIAVVTGSEAVHLLFYREYELVFPISFAQIFLAARHSDGMLINLSQNFKARLSQLIISTSRVFDFVAGSKKEGGNIFYHYCVLY